MQSRTVVSSLLIAALSASGAACAVTVPTPTTGPAPKESDIEVPYPPPPARVELLPAPKDSQQVWVDGQWDWSVDEWVWQRGEWTTPPAEAAYFTPWNTLRRGDGRLFFVPATWRDKDGKPVPAPTFGCSDDSAQPARKDAP